MKEIKFRSAHYFHKSVNNGEFSHFSYWGLLNHKGEHDNTCFSSPSSNSLTYRKAEEQFIGWKGKNEVEIYKGDKLFDGYSQTYTVIWDDTNCGFALLNGDNIESFNEYSSECLEVIGNIHQDKQNESKN